MSVEFFMHDSYQRHNRRRQEHLASLALPLAGKRVLELGAGVGDHTSFFIDRNCSVTVTDVREENIAYVRSRYPGINARLIDIEVNTPADLQAHDVVYAYGLLYHLGDPCSSLARIASLTNEMLLLETCVSFGAHEAVNLVNEDIRDPTQAAHGMGCRPTRPWVFNSLKRLFSHVYITRTQPWHEEFPIDWRGAPPANNTGLYRSVFVASRRPIANTFLADHLVDVQERV